MCCARKWRAGQIQPDVLLVADTINIGQLKAEGRLTAYPEAKVEPYDAAFYDKDKTYFGTKIVATGIAYNTASAQRPDSWNVLLDPAQKGLVAVPSPLYSGAALAHLHTVINVESIGWKFYEGLLANDIHPVGGNGPALNAVAAGQAKYGIIADGDVMRAKAKGSPVDFVYPKEGVSYITEPVAILKTAKNPEAAKAFVDFLLSEEGGKLVASQGNMPIYPNVPSPEGFPKLSDIKLLSMDVDAALAKGRRGEGALQADLRRVKSGPANTMSIVQRASNMPETSRSAWQWLPSSSNVVLAGLFVFVCIFSVAPIARLMLEGLLSGGALDLGRITRIFSQQSVWTATVNTVVMALGATAFAAILGGAMATVVTVTDLRWKPALIFCFILPLMIPPQVATLSWINFFGPSNPLLHALGLHRQALHPLYSMQGMIFVLGLHNAPLVFIAFRASLRAVPTDLVEAARIEGGGPLRVLATIVAPLSMSGAIAGCALAFVSIAGNFAIPAMLGIPGRIPTLITLIYQKLSDYGQDALGDVAVLALVLGGDRHRRAVCSKAGCCGDATCELVNLSSRPICFELGIWRVATELACWAVVFVVLVVPLLALLAAALVAGYGQPLNADTVTLENFSNALFRHTMVRNAFITSFWISLSTAVILTLITAPMAYFTVWRPSWLVRAQNVMVEIGYALPGTVVGIAAILLFVKPLPIVGISLYGTPWIILAAYLMNRIVLSLRPTISGFVQLDKSLEEAAQVVGAGFLRRMVDIILPLIAPAAFAGASLVS